MIAKADGSPPLLATVAMGYGHLRAAQALADAAGLDVVRADAAPYADAWEERVWARLRRSYEALSRGASVPGLGKSLVPLLDWITAIPRPAAAGTQAQPSASVRYLVSLAEKGFGEGLVGRLRRTGAPLWTTFYASAILAERAGIRDPVCVVTDVDVNRVWAPHDPAATTIRYCVPARRTARRLRAFGVPEHRIHVTGFPLPVALTGGDDLSVLRANLARRLRRLDPAAATRSDDAREALHVTFAVGGAGAQVPQAAALARGLRGPLAGGRVRLSLVAGTRPEVRERLERVAASVARDGAPADAVRVVAADDFLAYERRLHATLAETDVLWTKPSELAFFAALGLPLVLTSPLGAQERANGAHVLRRGVAFEAPPAHAAARWLDARWRDGSLAAAAARGPERMRTGGTAGTLRVALSPPPR